MRQCLVHVHPSPCSRAGGRRAAEPPSRTWGTWRSREDRRRAAGRAARRLRAQPHADLHHRGRESCRCRASAVPDAARGWHRHQRRGQLRRFRPPLLRYKRYRTQLAPTSSGSMAIRRHCQAAPTRPVVNFQGDGRFLMTGQELATAVQYGLPIVTIIANNGVYGTIRMHQEREYPNGAIGTTLMNPALCRLRAQLRRRRLHRRGGARLRPRPGAGGQQARRAASRSSSTPRPWPRATPAKSAHTANGRSTTVLLQ